MPNRILRAELLDSEAWLALKDNADRSAYIACLLTVDTLGTMPAGPHRLVKLWRPYGIDTPEKAAKVFADLADVDLVRRFDADGKPYLHVPRFRQSRRFLGHLWPISPWATNDEKQAFAKKSQVIHTSPPVILREPPIGVGVGVGVGVETKTKTKTTARKLAVSLPDGFAISQRIREWAEDKGHTDLERHLESFIAYVTRNGKKYVDWDAALQSAIRENWAKLEPAKPSRKIY